jgi:ribosomal protein L14E/L6E/L27E
LKDEYLALLGQRRASTKQLWEKYNNDKMEMKDEKPYAEGLIVHVDQLDPKCPKTTAIALLETSGIEIAFMNAKKKGLTSTYIRLKDAKDAIAICRYFDTYPTVQENEKDKTGKRLETKTFECLKLRVLTGNYCILIKHNHNE